MANNKNKLKFPNNDSILQNKKNEKFKSYLMEKYNLSSEKADELLIKLYKKIENNRNNSFLNQQKNDYSGDTEENIKNSLESKDNDGNISNVHKFNEKSTENNAFKEFKRNKEKQKVNTTLNELNLDERYSDDDSQDILDQCQSYNSEKVDLILESVIPNYDNQLSIVVNHVDLTFEVSNEKVDTIKEGFIRRIKGEKLKKIKIHALNDISFKIFKGEKIGIIGYNGAGKSTLLNVIAGVYPIDDGYVKTYGNISPLLSLGAGFDFNYSGRRNILLNGAILGYDKEFLESKIDEIIEFSELGDFIDVPIKNYSSGMIAKLGFSIATAVNPDILIIDEVLSVGDINFQKKSRDKIKSLMDGGTTVLFVSHSVPQVRLLCDKAIWIDNGKLREIGNVNEVCDHYMMDAKKASQEQINNIKFK